MAFLYEQFDTLKKMGMFNVEVPDFIQDNCISANEPWLKGLIIAELTIIPITVNCGAK